VLRDAVRDGSASKATAMMLRLRDEMIHMPQVAAFLVIDADGRVVGRTNEARDGGLRIALTSLRIATVSLAAFFSASLIWAEQRTRNGASSCRGASTRPAACSAASLRR